MVVESGAFIQNKRRLGEILLDRNTVVRGQLRRALKLQKKENRFIGEILTGLGFVTERDIVSALSAQCHFPYIAIDNYAVQNDVLDIIPRHIVFQYNVVPLDRVGNILSVVMLNPLDVSVIQILKELTSCEIVPFISTKIEIEQALHHFYGEK